MTGGAVAGRSVADGSAEASKPGARFPGRALLFALFALYAALLVWTVVWKLEPPYIGAGEPRAIKLVPFVQTREAGASAPLEVLANLMLFMPFGAYLGLLRPRRWASSLAIATAASLAMESAQYLLVVGMPDVTDVLVNATGGAIGLMLVSLVRLVLRGRAVAVLTGTAVAATVVALLATGAYLVSPLHFRQADVRVDAWNSHAVEPGPSGL